MNKIKDWIIGLLFLLCILEGAFILKIQVTVSPEPDFALHNQFFYDAIEGISGENLGLIEVLPYVIRGKRFREMREERKKRIGAK